MTIKIELPEALESDLRKRATREGLTLDRFILKKLDTKGEHIQDMALSEDTLIQLINENGISDSDWLEYRRLTALRQAEVITPLEYERLLKLLNLIEEKHAERLGYAMELARLWNITLQEVMKKFGIEPKG